MKIRLSFNKLLRNDKLMMICSAILAIVIWAVVVYGPSVTEETTITVPITVRLNSSAETGGNLPGQYFQVLSKTAESAEVVVSGNRSVLGKLKAEDIVVSADLSQVLEAVEDYTVKLTAAKNPSSEINDYTIEEIKTRQIKVTCDYVGESKFVVEKDISSVQVTDNTKYQLGTPTLDTQLLPNETITVSGPKKVRDRITKIVAKVNAEEAVSTSTVFDAKLMAYDKDDKQIDLSQCVFTQLTDEKDPTVAQVTVPVNYFCKATLGVKPTNLPKELAEKSGFIQLTPATIDLLGREDEVLKLVEELKQIPLDFDNVSNKDKRVSIALNIPEHVTVGDDITSVTATIDTAGLTGKTLSVPLLKSDSNNPASNVTIQNKPQNTSVEFSTKTLSVTIVGEEADVDDLKATELMVVIDMETQTARVTVPSNRAVWVYYGADSKDNLPVFVTAK